MHTLWLNKSYDIGRRCEDFHLLRCDAMWSGR